MCKGSGVRIWHVENMHRVNTKAAAPSARGLIVEMK